MEWGLLLRLAGVINHIVVLSCPFNIPGRNCPTDMILFKKNFNFGLYSHICSQISFKLDMMIKTTKLYILISVWMTLTFIQGHSCIRNKKKLWCPFSCKFTRIFVSFVSPRGSAEATRMAHAMITALVQEPEKDLSEIIARVKGKPMEKNPHVPVTIGDFAIGMFTIPTTTNQSSSATSQKSTTSKPGSSRQLSSSSSSGSNPGRTTGGSAGFPPTNVWQNPVPGPGAPSSPRHSPQKQVTPSVNPLKSAIPSAADDKAVGAHLGTDLSLGGACSPATTSTPLPSGSSVPNLKSQSISAIGRAGGDLHQHAFPGTIGGVIGQKTANRPASGNVRLLQRSQSGVSRQDPQPLPIVQLRMTMASSASTTSNNGTTSPASFSAFHLWNNTSPTPILSKKEDFASVAAAGVISTPSIQHSGQATPGSPTTSTSDPTKAPGYKAGIGSVTSHSHSDHSSVSSSLPFPMPNGSQEHHDLHKLKGRDAVASSASRTLPGFPSAAGDGDHISQIPQMPIPGPMEHLNVFSNHQASFFSQPPMYSGALPDQKEEYSTPHQPMTLPEIKSTLNPNAPDFQITGIGSSPGPGGMANGYPGYMGEMGNGRDVPFNGGTGGGGRGDGNTNGSGAMAGGVNTYLLACAYMQNQLQNLPPAVVQQLSMGLLGNHIDQSMELCYYLQRLYQQHQSSLGGNSGPNPGGPHHIGGPDGGPGINPGPGMSPGPGMNPGPGMSPAPGMSPGPSPGPRGHSPMSNYMSGQGLARNVSPMPGQHRPNSAPCLPGMNGSLGFSLFMSGV